VVQNLSEEMAFWYEKQLISFYGRKDIGTGILHNHTDGGERLSGHIFTKTHREKIGKSRKYFVYTPEIRRKMSESAKGKVLSEETKEKISKSTKGKPKTKQHAENIAKAQTGKKWTEERKQRHSKALRGRTFSEQAKKNMAAAQCERWRKVRESIKEKNASPR